MTQSPGCFKAHVLWRLSPSRLLLGIALYLVMAVPTVMAPAAHGEVQRPEILPEQSPDDINTLARRASELYQKGDTRGAIELWDQIYLMVLKQMGPDHPDVATSLNNLAVLYTGQGKYSKAEQLHLRSLAIREKALGPDHPDLAQSLNNLAELYSSQGQFRKAEPLYQRSLAIREKALGPGHPDVATSLNNLAGLYHSQGQYSKAEPLYQRSLVIREKAFGPDHPDVAASLNNLASFYGEKGDHDTALPLLQRSLLIWEKTLGPDHPNVATSLNNLAGHYRDKGQYDKALPLLQRSLSIREKAFGPDHPNVASSLSNLAVLYVNQGQYAKAEPLYQRSLAISERILGPYHPDIANRLINMADLYQIQGQHSKAEPLYQRSLAIWEKAAGPENAKVAQSLNNLATLYMQQGRYSKAEPLYQRSLAISEKALGPDHPEIATSLNNMASLYLYQGQYDKAKSLFQRSLAIREKALGPEHPAVAISLSSLAVLYMNQGQYAKAEPLYQRSLAIQEKVLGTEHRDLAQSLNNLAQLYSDQGQYRKAELLHLRSLAIREKALGPDHSDAAASLNNLAALYTGQGQYGKAESLYLRSLAIREKALGSGHPDVAESLNNLAELYSGQGQHIKAEPLHLRSLAVREKALGPGHPDVANSLNNLAGIYYLQGRYDKAELLLQQSLAIREKALGRDHPDVASSLNNLEALYWSQGEHEKAEKLHYRSLMIQEQWLRRELPLLPVGNRSAQLSSLRGAWSLTFAFIQQRPSAAQLALTTRLNRQGLLQEIEERQGLLLRTTGVAGTQLERLQRITQQLSMVTLPQERRNALRLERDQLQAALYRSLPNLQIESVSVADVAKALPADGALLEFQRFQPFDGKQPPGKRWGAARYLALILRPNGAITPVQLGLAQPIDTAILQALQASASNTSDATSLWGKVSQLVLQPLQSQLAGTRQWFLSPDGELNRVPFAAIPSPQQPAVPLAQAVQLRQLTTGRDLLRLQRPAKPGQPPLVMANPSYDRFQDRTPTIAAAAVPTAERLQQRSSGIDSTRWAPLPATQLEGQQVAALLGTQAITGHQATAMALQQRQGPRVLHIATHGFFAPDQDTPPSDPLRAVLDGSRQLRGFQGEDPQLRSGLVLAGANQPDADPNDDGYLTAAEATGLQLDGTELVTLSACSTAQGAIKTGEGVYGLQRSLTVAGARSTLLSLWKVDDAATAEFMQRFYKRLKAGEGRADALQAVQQEFRTDPALKARGWDSIFYWGAWQLVGDWRPIQGL